MLTGKIKTRILLLVAVAVVVVVNGLLNMACGPCSSLACYSNFCLFFGPLKKEKFGVTLVCLEGVTKHELYKFRAKKYAVSCMLKIFLLVWPSIRL